MLSGNGRHRRPRQAPALLVAAGVTGSAIAIPLLGAGSASAADGATWDRVAECESGGSWSQNTGNGYYGGLQLTQDDWEAYGGLAYAPSADQASRGQQIAVAERILADRGVGAWRTCGLTAGLEQGSAPAGTGAGGTEDSGPGASTPASPSPSAPADPSASPDAGEPSASAPPSSGPAAGAGGAAGVSGEPGRTPSASGAPKSDESDKSGQSEGSSEFTEGVGTGRHRGIGAEEAAGGERTAEASGRHASRGADAPRDAADGSYTVRSGDSLWSIADSLELEGGWRALYAKNEQAVGADPNLILPGQELEVGVGPDEG